ncbi:MAG: carbohydrate-binding protein [Anaeromyxobacter sp.]
MNKLLLSALALVPALAFAAGEVQLLTVEAYQTSHYGIYAENREALVRVQNLGYAKQLSFWAEMADGSWQEVGAGTYVQPSGGNTELWRMGASVTALGGGKLFGNQFVIRYVVDGREYWDNDGGRNFRVDKNEGDHLIAGNALLKWASAYVNGQGSVSFYGNVLVRNLAHAKAVTVVYSTDGWATTRTVSATFDGAHQYAYGGSISYPTVSGTEAWSFNATAPAGTRRIEYAVAYTVAGRTYWDNNNGANYALALP